LADVRSRPGPHRDIVRHEAPAPTRLDCGRPAADRVPTGRRVRPALYTDGGGRLYAISAATGARAWRYDAHRGSAASPAVGPYAHGTVYASFLNRLPAHEKDPHDGEVVALAAGTGRVRWSAHIGASETSPLLLDGRVYVGGWDGVVYALDARTGRRLWAYGMAGAIKGGLAAGAAVVYAGSYDGHVYALDAATGRLVWRAAGQPSLFHHGTFYATPVVAYERVYVGSTDGRMPSTLERPRRQVRAGRLRRDARLSCRACGRGGISAAALTTSL